jgi:hypothetical protein
MNKQLNVTRLTVIPDTAGSGRSIGQRRSIYSPDIPGFHNQRTRILDRPLAEAAPVDELHPDTKGLGLSVHGFPNVFTITGSRGRQY